MNTESMYWGIEGLLLGTGPAPCRALTMSTNDVGPDRHLLPKFFRARRRPGLAGDHAAVVRRRALASAVHRPDDVVVEAPRDGGGVDVGEARADAGQLRQVQ